MGRVGTEVWAGLAMLVVAVGVAAPTLFGLSNATVSGFWWAAIFVAFLAGLVLATSVRRRSVRYAALLSAVLASWALVLTAQSTGILLILLVVAAATSVYVVPLWATLVLVGLNTAVIAKELHLSDGIADLVGTTTLDGAVDIDTHALVTLKCSGCGAEVTLNTEKTLSATCHWCRHVLSMSNAVESGTVPDAILPFHIAQDDALNRMRAYVSERGTHLDDAFVQDFSQASLHAVYLPYLVVDGRVVYDVGATAPLALGPRPPRRRTRSV